MKKLLLFALASGQALFSFGQWTGNPAVNTPVYVGSGDQQFSGTIADGSGGIIVSWQSELEVSPATTPASYTTAPYVQKLSSAGLKQWSPEGVKVSDLSVSASASYIVSDGNGGVIITWEEDEAGSNENIYAQRIDANGNRLWGNNGIALTTAAGSQMMGGIIADGAGGAIITWTDEAPEGAYKIYAQRLNSSGATQWTSGGVLLSDNVGYNSGGYIFNDTAGGYVIVWEEEIEGTTEAFEGSKVYWQKLNADGSRQVPTNTLIFDFPPSDIAYTYIINAAPDGTGGIYLAIAAENDTNAALYLQHVLANGTKAFGSNQLGLELDAAMGSVFSVPGFSFVNYSVAISSDNAGGAVVGWTDTRSGKSGYYAQRTNAAGTKLWGANDVALISEDVIPTGLSGLVSNSEGHFVFSISKGSEDFSQISLYAQKVSPAGAVQFGTEGVAIATSSGFKYGQLVATNENIVFAWSDSRAGEAGTLVDIYAQSLNNSGTLPVHFLDFRATYHAGKTKLSWTTASESNSDYFVVERSENASEFSSITSLKSTGTTAQLSNYNYSDADAVSGSGSLYYRIKQVDNDGKYTYSEIVSVKVPALKNIASVSYFPNPVKNKLTLDFKNGTSTPITYSLIDLSGRVLLHNTEVGSLGKIEINMENLQTGVYLLRIDAEGKTYRQKLIKN